MHGFLSHEPDVTVFLARLRAGQPIEDETRLRLLYEALRSEARRQAVTNGAGPIAPTELVQEVCIKLLLQPSGREMPWRDRDHFFGVASRAMRNLSIDAARRRRAVCRGGDRQRADETVLVGSLRVSAEALAQLREGLDALRAEHARSAVGFELHVFAGWAVADVATALDVSPATAYGDLTFARAMLQRHLEAVAFSGARATAAE